MKPIKSIQLITIFYVLSVAITALATNPTNPTDHISTKSVLQKLNRKQNILLVDIRSKQDFEKLKIPGSINIPLHFIKTKPFLKTKPVVLVNGGYQSSRLKEDCRRLKESGFNISILTGGLIAWHRRGGRLEGDLLLLKTCKEISPRIFFQEKDYQNQVIIDASEVRSKQSKDLIPFAIHIPLPGSLRPSERISLTEAQRKDVSLCPAGTKNTQRSLSLCERQDSITSVLIFNEDGTGYDNIERKIEKTGMENVFYLKGGLQGYKKFLQHQAMLSQPRDSRIKTVKKCKNCGSEK